MIVLTGLSALCVTACGSSREVARSSDRVATYETERAEKEVDSVVVIEHDTIMEVTTIHVRTNEAGDTLFQSVVTDRERGRSRDAIAVQKTKVEVVRDTVVVEKRDSVNVETFRQAQGDRARASPVVSALKWIFWIIIGLIVLMIVVRIRGWP